jgi:hypothetical protein
MVLVMSPRPDLLTKVSHWRFVIEQGAALATAATAATAAFSLTVPGHSRRVVALPALPLALWLGTLVQGCIQDWVQFGPDGMVLTPDWLCFPAIAVGAVPAITLVLMLRRGAP